MVVGLVREPRFRAQARGDQTADALADLEHRIAGAGPDRAATDDDDGLLRFRDDVGRLLERCGVGRYCALTGSVEDGL